MLKEEIARVRFSVYSSGYVRATSDAAYSMQHTGKMSDSLGHRTWVPESYRSERVHMEQISSTIVVNRTHLLTDTCRLQAPFNNCEPVYEF